MTTGKIEYSPDYKSKSQVKRIAAQQSNTLTRTDALIKEINERQRLERAVIDAVKEWRKDIIVDEPLRVAVDALLAFEANRKNG